MPDTITKEVRHGEFRAIDAENRMAEFVISTDAKDRHGTRLNMENWNLENYNANPVVGYNHEVYGGGMCEKSDPDDVIGKGEVFMEDPQRGVGTDKKKLIGRVHFEKEGQNPRADKVFNKVKDGVLNATSVGFAPIPDDSGEIGQYGYVNKDGEKVDADTFYFNGQELLEFSIVNIPSNPEAVNNAIRSQTHNALLFVKEALGANYSFSDIEQLKVGDVIDAIEKGTKPDNANKEETVSKEVEGEHEEEETEMAKEAEKQLEYKRKELSLKLKMQNNGRTTD